MPAAQKVKLDRKVT